MVSEEPVIASEQAHGEIQGTWLANYFIKPIEEGVQWIR